VTLIQRLDLDQYVRLIEEVDTAKEHLDVELRKYRKQPEVRKELWKEFLFQWSPTLLALSNAERSWRVTHNSRRNLYQWIATQRQLEEQAA
jgi:hypothetical protein